MSDVSMLAAFSDFIHSTSSVESKRIETEIQKRHLLDVREAEEAQSSTFKVGMRSNVLLAAFGMPTFVIVGPSIPGIQVWRYTKIFAEFHPLDADPSKNAPVRWDAYRSSSNEWGGPQFYIKDGVVVGFTMTAPHKDKDSDYFAPLHSARSGFVPYVPVSVAPPMSIFFCATGRCGDALMIRRG